METTMTAASARKKMPCPTEGVEQATLFSWAQMRTYWYPELTLMFHIPNGGKRSKAEAGRFRAEGVKSGVPDICLPVARGGYHGLFIELKRQQESFKLRSCKHKNCKYRATSNNAYGVYNCDYALITGHTRAAQHPPDKRQPADCMLYEPRTGKKPRRKPFTQTG